MMQQANFNYFSLGKAFEKQTKTIKDQGEKQIKVIQTQDKLKHLKNILMMMKIVHQLQSKKKYLINSQTKCLMICLS